jgi:hypothetical protein
VRRLWSIGIVCVWLVMLALLVQRTWPPAPPSSVTSPAETTAPAPGEDWMGVYHGDQKIGYTHHRLSALDGGFTFEEASLLRLTVLDTPQTVRTRMHGHIGPDFTLRDVEFELSSGAGNMHATAEVSGTELRLALRTGKEVSEQALPLNEPVYLPSTLRASVSAGSLKAGQQLEALVFDPTTLKNDRIQLTVEAEDAVPHATPAVRGWRVREEFRGLRTVSWVDATGSVLREEGPMGFVLIRETADQAVNQGWSTQTALDLVASAAVPVARPIDDPRNRASLRLRLSGIAVEKVPSDAEQVRNGSVLTITRRAVTPAESYALPYQGTEHADDLAATAFLQSDHPRLQALAHEIIGNGSDARGAAVRLNDWVYTHLRKVPTVSIPNALQVLDMGEGDCNEHAVLLAALARAGGIPARLVAGVVYLEGAFFYHAWCEVWFGRWVSIDPTFRQFPADATHIKFAVGGPEEQLVLMEIIGRLGIEGLDDTDEAGGP